MALNGDFFDKFPGEAEDFEVDASGIFVGGDTISSISVTSSDLTISNSGFNNIAETITFRAAGGIAGSVAKVVVQANMASGQIRQKPAYVLIKPL
jgi:GTP cyclohydrolase III